MSHVCTEQECGHTCSYDKDFGRCMTDGDVSYGDYTQAELRDCNCPEHGECPEPGCILPIHDRSAKWNEHYGYGGVEWDWRK